MINYQPHCSQIHEYKSPHNDYAHMCQTRLTNKIAKSFIHQGPKLWSNLPSELRIKNSIKSLTNFLKQHFTTQYFNYQHRHFFFVYRTSHATLAVSNVCLAVGLKVMLLVIAYIYILIIYEIKMCKDFLFIVGTHRSRH